MHQVGDIGMARPRSMSSREPYTYTRQPPTLHLSSATALCPHATLPPTSSMRQRSTSRACEQRPAQPLTCPQGPRRRPQPPAGAAHRHLSLLGSNPPRHGQAHAARGESGGQGAARCQRRLRLHRSPAALPPGRLRCPALRMQQLRRHRRAAGHGAARAPAEVGSCG